MENAATTTGTNNALGQKDAHAKTVSRQMAEQFRTIQSPSFDMFKSFARDYVDVCLTPEDGDSLSASTQMDLAHALRIELPADASAEAKPFDDFVTQLYALY